MSTYKSEIEGKGCIVARVVAYSTTSKGNTVATFELEYPRFIHGEVMTHRLFSRNAMSSRAVPVEKMIEQVQFKPAMPIHWGKNQAGMQAKEEITDNLELHNAKAAWIHAAKDAASRASKMSKLGLHKQIVNRILEPYQVMKTVLTATELNNFFYLRRHEDAQPEIKELADCMYEALDQVEPELLREGEWHTPYVDHFKASDGDAFLEYHVGGEALSIEDALKVSASCCAQVSFRVCDDGVGKAKRIYDRLVESKPVHASPFEHQASPMKCDSWPDWNDAWLDVEEDGVTHADRLGDYWSGNLKGWVQYRQLIKDNVYN